VRCGTSAAEPRGTRVEVGVELERWHNVSDLKLVPNPRGAAALVPNPRRAASHVPNPRPSRRSVARPSSRAAQPRSFSTRAAPPRLSRDAQPRPVPLPSGHDPVRADVVVGGGVRRAFRV
jgi:hypothetical protein